MKKLIIIIQIITIIVLLSIPTSNSQQVVVGNAQAGVKEGKCYYMTITFYSRNPKCISKKYNDGYTATMTPIREGVAAINVDKVGNKWVVRSPLKLGDKIYIEGLGYYSVEDTGYFTDRDYKQDYWNVDIYVEDYQKAIEGGRQFRKVYVIK